ncbi:MAG: glycoside hydrolase family 20 zincin-like fold domain-containing protein [Candidatus Latescibacter sp.]|nr:glycoside hydrolase family 20 zincin-like fold domain-containing protein [Candidatus Latescibacter sp.]
MAKTISILSVLFTICFGIAAAGTISPQEEKQWLRYLIPLPHEISIRHAVTLNPADVRITLRKNAGEIEKNAARELEELFKTKSGKMPAGKSFEIRLGVRDSGVGSRLLERLGKVSHPDQGYIIQPVGTNRLILTGLHEKGVYYAARTLYQLLEPKITPDAVSVPLASVFDWPDMDERGVWNFPSPSEWIPWMTSYKMNWGNMYIQPSQIKRSEKNVAIIDTTLLREGRIRAFNYLPEILHLNFLAPFGLFRAYPELAGVGDGALAGRYFAHKEGDQHRAPCASNPLLTGIITEWLTDIARQGGNEVTCWLTERPAQCGCATCTSEGQFVWEARAYVNAWREARKTWPNLRIRLFISTTTDQRYHKVLAEAPPEVRIERCCATTMERVEHEPRDLFADPLFDRYAAEGRWVATYDVPLIANGKVDTPEFKVPQSSAHRIRDYVRQLIDRRWSAAYGMMAWGNAAVRQLVDPAGSRQDNVKDMARIICGFDIIALSEWSWNVNGRSEQEFAVAWATREGYENPEAVGEWSELMGPVEFDVYDSDFPVCYSWGKAASMVRDKVRPMLGEGMFRYYRDTQDFDRKIDACGKALTIAGGFRNPYLANETRVIVSYIKLAKTIYLVAEQVSTDDLHAPGNQITLRESLKNLNLAGKENVEAIRNWRGALGPEPWSYRVYDAIKGTETTVKDITGFVSYRYLY